MSLITVKPEGRKDKQLPVKIGTIGPLSEAEFAELRQRKTRKADPTMAALLDEIATGQPVKVPLVDGQRARGLRVAISRAATSRGLSVETLEGDASLRCGRSINRLSVSLPKHRRRGNGEGGRLSRLILNILVIIAVAIEVGSGASAITTGVAMPVVVLETIEAP
jgi:hypothetical protein